MESRGSFAHVTLSPNGRREPRDWCCCHRTGAEAVERVKGFLCSAEIGKLWYPTLFVHDVQEDEAHQRADIDLHWLIDGPVCSCSVTIEVKGDRHVDTGNFFLETVSCTNTGSPGAFVKTKAEWYFYYFLSLDEFYCLPMVLARPWFECNRARFPKRTVRSRRGKDEWGSVGVLVPIAEVLRDVEDVRHFRLVEGVWRSVVNCCSEHVQSVG